MNSENLNEQQSMEIIQDMSKTAKQDHQAGGSYYFILWGSIVMLFSILTYIAEVTKANWQPWTFVLFALGGVLSILRGRHDDKTEKSKSWYDSLYMYAWGGAGIGLLLVWGFAGTLGINNAIPLTMTIYAIASFTTGGVTKYYPSLIGSIICFICVIIAFNVSFAYQNLVCAFAVLCTHIIPGLMMRKYDESKGYAQ